jgi:XTP/dITP diphosphohydrolase
VGNEGILKMLESEHDRRAVAQCFIAYHDGNTVSTVKGEISGTISDSVRGSSGFGWDKIFIPERHTRTFGEMNAEEKNAISHRKLAFENLKEFFYTINTRIIIPGQND